MTRPPRDGKSGLPRLADLHLWHRVAETVQPLPRRRRPESQPRPGSAPSVRDGGGESTPSSHSLTPSPQSAPTGASQPPHQPAAPERLRRTETRALGTPLTSRGRPRKTASPELSHGTAADLDKRTLIRLRRGLVPVEAVVDLHGHTQDEAHRNLEAFLATSQRGGRRCVLVITGKGARSEGVLRAAVPRWLNQQPNRGRVLAFAYASPAHGGEGALYVLLKRPRQLRGS